MQATAHHVRIRETSAGGIVLHDGRVLLLRRGRSIWTLPKGKVEAGESPEAAAVREVREETGVAARVAVPLGTTSYRYRAGSGATIHKTVRWFLMRYQGGTVRAERTFQEGRWVPAEEAAQRISYPNEREVVARALRTAGAAGPA